MSRKRILEIVLSPDYTGLTTKELAKLVLNAETVPKEKMNFILAATSQMVAKNFLRRDNHKIFPTQTTKNYYDFLVNYRERNKR